MRFSAVLLVAAILTGCAKHAALAPTAAPPQPAVRSAMERQTRNAVIAGEGDQQVKILRQRLALAPDANDVRVQLAERYEASGFPDVALEHIRMARAREPQRRDLLLMEVGLLRKLELPGEAAASISAFLEKQSAPDSGLQAWLGITSDEAGKLPAGERAHRAALALSPDEDSLHNNLGYNLMLQRRYDEAAAEFGAALRLNQRSDTARGNLARVLAVRAGNQDPTGAVAHWTMAMEPAAAHSNLAGVYIEQGQYQKAREELAVALRYRRDYWPALRNLELVAELDGHPAELPSQSSESRWSRFTAACKRVFVQTEEEVPGRPKSNTRASR
jgi:Flp pilus assembly protein TadD